MIKFCIFCGDVPEKKSKEHVVPEWLIELTGNPRRDILLGLVGKEDRTFPFNQLHFPSCTKCNYEFSQMEAATRAVVLDLLSSKQLAIKQVCVLLDWLDKVRVGLWLGYLYLNRNRFEIKPRFHIASRIGQSDRMVAIYRVDGHTPGINFFGVQTPMFQYLPSCFMLRINHLYFFNMSDAFLFSARLGFPYPKSSTTDKVARGYTVKMGGGTGFAKFPLIRNKPITPALDFYQPIIPKGIRDLSPALYDSRYVRENCLDWTSGIGAVFGQVRDRVVRLKAPVITDALSRPGCKMHSFQHRRLVSQVLEFQNYLSERYDADQIHDPVERSNFKKAWKSGKILNNILIRKIKEGISRYES